MRPIWSTSAQISRCAFPLARIDSRLQPHRVEYVRTLNNGLLSQDSANDSAPSLNQSQTSNHSAKDHRKIGSEQSLWTLHPSSPGSPIFTPEGTHVFQKLQAFLRAQYPAFGFQEVVTPTIYKKSLWEQSGHWENYKDDMFVVSSGKQQATQSPPSAHDRTRLQPPHVEPAVGDDAFGLKPMNCPGHCLLFASQRRSYNDLPIRYADFSPLHRDEISGALTGLTRVRRFHQDDGHIFCRPSQVKSEILKSLELMSATYNAFGIRDYHFVLSTRPAKEFIGTQDEWDQAETQLKEALEHWSTPIVYNKGDGAFYGPKIDAILKDADGKNHQIGTVQLDFQLPKRFDLHYVASADVLKTNGQAGGADGHTEDQHLGYLRTDGVGLATPIMIHRAIFGSLERFMALLMEQNKGKWPFWLNPRPIIVLTVNNDKYVQAFAETAVAKLSSLASFKLPRPQSLVYHKVDLDSGNETISKKVAMAKQKAYSIIVVIGKKNAENAYLDVDMSGIVDKSELLETLGSLEGFSQYGTISRLRLSTEQLQHLMQVMTDEYI
ncbi:MAG: threonyl-tRNA synthetase [Ramalina farinacea]|uniref:threonine--tRNA ligase n=1 Tax=Ramalina farinacea TaxID=258253 RepID=A0AA43QPL0_9LECA|nr:threonyl-tRNA synthetase [Ramalina farinacea]